MLKLSCDIVPEVAKGQGAEVEKSLHEMGEGQCYCIWTSTNTVDYRKLRTEKNNYFSSCSKF